LVFLDESGFCLIPSVRKTWAPIGKTPILKIAGGWTKISAISAISVSPRKRRINLYTRFHVSKNIRRLEVLAFLRHLLRHLKKGFVLVWDSSAIHKSDAVKKFIKTQGRIHAYRFPGYAPELNPDEFVWGHFKRDVANSVPKDTRHLRYFLYRSAKRLKHSERLLWSCVKASELPWG
jgi:putative transposase